MRKFPRSVLLLPILISSGFAQTSVLTYHNDNARTGQNQNETILNPSLVNSTNFGKLFTQAIDGYAYAQPLYVPNVAIPSLGTHNVVYVATEHDSVYAFDADNNSGANATWLWHTSFLGPGVTTVSSNDVSCGQITPEIGITATPVIDPIAGTIFVVAMTKEVSGTTTTYVQRLHALNMYTGVERTGSPVVIQASVPGTADGGSTVTFVPKNYKSRPGLLLLNGTVYTFWSSHCDNGSYHGWVIGYDGKTLQQTAVYNTTPNGNEASIWNSGAAPAADSQNNIYVLTGNGAFNADSGGPNYADSFIKLSTAGGKLTVADYFAPSNRAALSAADEDIGSGGILVLPDGIGGAAHPNLLVGAGKEGKIYLLDRQQLGKFSATTDNAVQELPNAIGGSFGMPAYFNNAIYYGGTGDHLKMFNLSGGLLATAPASQSPATFGYPGTTPSVSAYGNSIGVVWAIESASQAALHAYNAANIAQELYNSGSTGGRDNAGAYVKFTVPTVANGKVYVGTQSTIAVFGLLNKLDTAVSPVSGSGSNVTLQLTYSDPAGAADIAWAEALLNNALAGANGCWIFYNPASNLLYLASDAASGLLGPVTAGSQNNLENSQCLISTSGVTVSAAGNNLVLNVPLTFKTAFGGSRNIFMLTQNKAGQNSGWQSRGTFTVSGAAPPTAVSIVPASGSGNSVTFQTTYSDLGGANNVAWAELLINGSLSATNGCWILYYRPSNSLYLFNDAFTGAAGPVTVGSAGTIQNSQCTVDSGASSVATAGNNLTLNTAVTFKSGAWSGTKMLYGIAQDNAGQVGTWQNLGSWIVP